MKLVLIRLACDIYKYQRVGSQKYVSLLPCEIPINNHLNLLREINIYSRFEYAFATGHQPAISESFRVQKAES